MKNLIITTGILILMITGILYDEDCSDVVRQQRRLAWTCEEMAAGAWIAHWEKGQSEENAEAVAGEILQRNLKDGCWEMECQGSEVTVYVDLGDIKTRLRFLQGAARLQAVRTFNGLHNF